MNNVLSRKLSSVGLHTYTCSMIVAVTRGYMSLVPVDQAMEISGDDYTWYDAHESDLTGLKFPALVESLLTSSR